MSWDLALADHLEYLRSLGRTRATIEQRAYVVQKFSEFCRPRGIETLQEVSTHDTEAFRHHLMWGKSATGKLFKAHSVHAILVGVRSYFRWLFISERVMLDPFRDMVVSRVSPTGRQVPSARSLAVLLERPVVQTPFGLRNHALLELLYGSGVRRQECYLLDVDDVDFEQRTILVRMGKGNKTRVQALGDRLLATVKDYVLQARPALVCNPMERALWIGRHGHRLQAGQISRIVQASTASLGLEDLTPHRLRAAFATHLLAGGANVVDVQHLMGHDRLQSTHLYTRLTPAQVAMEHSRTHPRAR